MEHNTHNQTMEQIQVMIKSQQIQFDETAKFQHEQKQQQQENANLNDNVILEGMEETVEGIRNDLVTAFQTLEQQVRDTMQSISDLSYIAPPLIQVSQSPVFCTNDLLFCLSKCTFVLHFCIFVLDFCLSKCIFVLLSCLSKCTSDWHFCMTLRKIVAQNRQEISRRNPDVFIRRFCVSVFKKKWQKANRKCILTGTKAKRKCILTEQKAK